jgi:PfaB family protein
MMTLLPLHPAERLAIVGMDLRLPGCTNLRQFVQRIYAAGSVTSARSMEHGEACLTEVIEQAIQDAALPAERRILVLAACAEAFQATFEGVPVVDLSEAPNPIVEALRLAGQSLVLSSGEETPRIDAVVFAASSGRFDEALTLSPDASPAPRLGWERAVHAARSGVGLGAVVLTREDLSFKQARQVYAVVNHVAAVGDGRADETEGAADLPALEDVRNCCQAALSMAGVNAGQIGYLEAFASGRDALDGIEIAGLVQGYRQPYPDLSTALGSVQTVAGDLGRLAGLAGLIQAAACLYWRFFPAVPDWNAPKLPALWRNAPFFVPMESRAWFVPHGATRLAGVNCIGQRGSFGHLILKEAGSETRRPEITLSQQPYCLIPLNGDSREALESRLEDLQLALFSAGDVRPVVAQFFEEAQEQRLARYAVSIMADTQEGLLREVDLARKAVPAAFERGVEWQTPQGSYFTPQPVGQSGEVALVYPGAFNSYPGVGKDLFYLFPELHRHADELTADFGQVIHERLLYPRSLTVLSKEDLAAVETQLLADPIAMLVTGTALAVLYTRILTEIFKIHPDAAFGYSLGENSMMYACNVWGQGDSATARLIRSETFRERLAGRQLAVREHWGMMADPQQEETSLWSNYLVMADPEAVRTALAREPHAYLTHVNTPRQVVIGGDPAACQRVIAGLRCSSIRAPFDYALHCEAMASEEEGLMHLHHWPIETIPDLKMYTAADDAALPVAQTSESQDLIARKIAHMLVSPLDFPRLVRKVYAEGARVFIEVGAGGNCARWVDESLKGSPHLAVSLDRRGTENAAVLVRSLARLYSHRVPMDLSACYEPGTIKVNG